MNMTWAKRWLLENFNTGNMAGLEKMYHPNVKFADVPLGVDATGWAEVKGFLGGFGAPGAGKHAFVPDAYLGNEREGVVEWTWSGTMDTLDLFQVGDGFQGKSFKVRGNSVFRFDEQGRIVEERDYWDLSTVLRQIKESKVPTQVPKSAGRVARPSDEIEEEEMSEAQADGRVHAQSHTPTIAPGGRDA